MWGRLSHEEADAVKRYQTDFALLRDGAPQLARVQAWLAQHGFASG